MDTNLTYSAFSGTRRLVTGPLESVLREIKHFHDAPGKADANDGPLLVFSDQKGQQFDYDLRGSIEEVLRKALPARARTGPGRPKLGVVSREVTLLPRQWEWLESQPNGASAALRRLVEDARKNGSSEQTAGARPSRARIEAVGRIMWVLAGNLPGFEEASRALYRHDMASLAQRIEGWPPDVRSYILEHAIE